MVSSTYDIHKVIDLSMSYKLWDLKESHDLTVFGLAKKLNENPVDVENWLAGEVEVTEDKKKKIETLELTWTYEN